MKIGGTNTIDFARVSKFPKFVIDVKSRDRKRAISLILLENNTPINLNNYTVTVAAKKSDGNDIFNDVTVVDAKNGICEVEVTEQMLALDTDLPCEIVLYGEDGTVATSSNFVIGKISSVRDENSIISSSEFTGLTKALSEVKNIDNRFKEVNSQLEHKANTIDVNSKIWSMANMGQDIKEAITGGSVAVVGKNSVLAENIVNGEVTPSKLSNITVGKNKFNKNAVTYGCYYEGSTGKIIEGVSSSGLNCISEIIPCEVGKAYYRNKQSNVIYWNNAMEYIGRESVAAGTFTPVEESSYMTFSLNDAHVETFQIHEGSSSSSYENYKVFCNDYGLYGTDLVDVYWYRSSLIKFIHNKSTVTIRITPNASSPGGIYVMYADKKIETYLFTDEDGGDIEFVIPHNNAWVYNILTKTFSIKPCGSDSVDYINHRNGDILLLANLQGRFHAGYLIKDYRFIMDNKKIAIQDITMSCSVANTTVANNTDNSNNIDINFPVNTKFVAISSSGSLIITLKEAITYTIPSGGSLVLDLDTKEIFVSTDYTSTENTHINNRFVLANVINGRIRGGYCAWQLNDIYNRDLYQGTKNQLVDVYCRYENGLNIKTSGTNITFTIDLAKVNPWTIYTLNVAGIYNKYIANVNWVETEEGETSTELVYILAHNGMLILDTINKKVKVEDMTKYKVDYSTNKDILLALNIDGKIVAGELKEDFNDILRQQESKVVATNEKCDIGKFKFKFDVDLPSSYMSSHSLVDDELWIFPVSNDEGTNTATCVRYRVDFENNNAELVGSFTHNWGHVNSSSYSPLTDSIICGNGSGSYNLMGQIFIFENARSFRDRSNVNRNEAIIIDVQEFGCKCNVVWGEANGGKGNICYVVSNDNQNIRKLLLGQGANQFENGVFLEGKTGLQFNGTYKILGEWTMPRIDVNQGTNYENGALYIGLGHDTIWFTKNRLHDDGTVSYETYKEYRYDDTGAYIYKNMQGITVTDKYIIVGQDSGTHEILVYYK